MRSPHPAPSATSLPRAPRDDADARITRYVITMGIRVACFVAMLLIQPFGWYTWVFAAAAVFLPYIAVVIANVGAGPREARAENPERMLEAPAPAPEAPSGPTVIRISETRRIDPGDTHPEQP